MDTLGPELRSLGYGFGQFAVAVLGQDVPPFERPCWIKAVDDAHIEWRDTRADEFYGVAFGGEFSLGLAAGLISIQASINAASMLMGAPDCESCRFSVTKLRLVMLYQAVESLRWFSVDPAFVLSTSAQQNLRSITDVPFIDGKDIKFLRNTMVHYGFSKQVNPTSLAGDGLLDALIRYFVGMTYVEFKAELDRSLEQLATGMNAWVNERAEGAPRVTWSPPPWLTAVDRFHVPRAAGQAALTAREAHPSWVHAWCLFPRPSGR